MKHRGVLLTIVACVLCFAAAVVCYNLLLKHVTGSGAAWFEAGCTDAAGPGKANCAKVLASPYSYFPAKKPDAPAGKFHVPVAWLGLGYYCTLLIWLIGIGRPSRRRRWLHVPLLLVVIGGLCASAYYTMIMYRVLDEWCPWCLVTHVLNLLIAVCVLLLWPWKSTAAASENAAIPAVRPHPSFRVVFLTLLAIIMLWDSNFSLLGLRKLRKQAAAAKEGFDNCMAAVNRIKGDSNRLLQIWQLSKPHNIARRSDDPVRIRTAAPPDQPPLDVVVFSDFECPSCGRFAEFFETKVEPMFDGRVRATFKHYPIDQTCNPRVSSTMHKFACAGAALTEAARLLKGNEGFWKAHDFLYQNRNDLAAGKMTPERVAEAVGADAASFREAVKSGDIARRITEDADQAKACEIRGTPAVFVNGKVVDTLAATEIGFWDKLADWYWGEIKVARPASTMPAPETTTPGNPGPTTAP